MGKRTPKNLVVKDEHGVLWVQARAVMHPLVPFMDGLKCAMCFSRIKHIYITVNDAILWQQNKIKETNGKGGDQSLLDILMEINSWQD